MIGELNPDCYVPVVVVFREILVLNMIEVTTKKRFSTSSLLASTLDTLVLIVNDGASRFPPMNPEPSISESAGCRHHHFFGPGLRRVGDRLMPGGLLKSSHL